MVGDPMEDFFGSGGSTSSSGGGSESGESLDEMLLDRFFTSPNFIGESSSDGASVGGTSVRDGSVCCETPNQVNLKWVDETTSFVKQESGPKPSQTVSSAEVDLIRKRFIKKKTRPLEQVHVKNQGDIKKVKNTLAARRYRERQRKDFEALDARIKQLEQELSNSNVEKLWWQMEAKRWEDEARK